MNTNKMLEWICSSNTGISSRTMWIAIMDLSPKNSELSFHTDTPSDVFDFERCFNLVKYAEINSKDLDKVSNVFPYFTPIIKAWNELSKAYIDKDISKFYEIFEKCKNEEKLLKSNNN